MTPTTGRIRPRTQVRVTVEPLLAPAEVVEADPRERRDESLLEHTRARYDWLFSRYRSALGDRQAPWLDVTNDGVRERVVIDGGLWQTLFEMYLYQGWDAIAHVETCIQALFRNKIPATSPWQPARQFYEATRALIGGLVRDGLVELERACTVRMVANGSVSSVAVDSAWIYYGFTRTVHTHYRPAPDGAAIEEEQETFTFGNEMAAMKLFAALTDAVRERTAYEAELQHIANVRADVQRLRGTAQRFRERGIPLSSDDQLKRELDLTDAKADALKERATALHAATLKVINLHSPLGVLPLEGLSNGFTIDELAGLLGAELWQLRRRLDALGARLRPDTSKVAELLPSTDFEDMTNQIQAGEKALAVPVEGPERAVIAAATDALSRDAGWFPMLHEVTLTQLAETDLIQTDSWLYVVWTRYVATLGRVLGDRRHADEQSVQFWSWFAKAASAASLALIVTPATTAVGVASRAAATVADLVLFAHTISSVTGQLARLNELQDHVVLAPDAFAIEGLARIGELGKYQQALLTGIGQQVLIELVLIATGAQWPVVKEAMTLRGFMQDVQTLLGTD